MSASLDSTLGLNARQSSVFHTSMTILDDNYAPPLLWGTAKLSAWYAVGLLARQASGDVERANKLLHNCLTQQYRDERFTRNYGSFKQQHVVPFCGTPNSVWEVGEIYDAYDPNNGLFVTMAGVMIHARYKHLIEEELWTRFGEAMVVACQGQAMRRGGEDGDDLWPAYSNPFFLRCVCSTYVGHHLGGGEKMIEDAESWTSSALSLWSEHSTPGEYNSPTYIGVTLLALGLASFCPSTSLIHRSAPRMIADLWEDLSRVYNPTLKNIAGPWDRAYGFDMTRYYASIAGTLAAIVGLDDAPWPRPLNGSEHFTDIASVPMQMIVAPFIERYLNDSARQRLCVFEGPHTYSSRSRFPPHDTIEHPRAYSFFIGEGLNVGGVSYDEDQLGGPKGIVEQWCPAVIQWDSGNAQHGGGCGWMSLWPTSRCMTIQATANSLRLTYPPSRAFPKATTTTDRMDDNDAEEEFTLHIGAIPFFELDKTSFLPSSPGASNEAVSCAFPGLNVTFRGNIITGTDQQGRTRQRELKFSKKQKRYGSYFYVLRWRFSREEMQRKNSGEVVVPEVVIEFERTPLPENCPLRM